MNHPKSDRIIAIAATIVFHVAVLLILLSAFLRYVDDSETRRWPPADKSEILAVDDLGEFVKLGDIPEALPASESDAQPAETDAADHSPDIDLTNLGEKATPPKPLTSEKTSPMKVEKKEEATKPKKTGPTAEELAEKERIRQQEETRKKIAERMKFNNSGSGTGQGNAGSPDGNASHGASSGAPGHNLSGRSFISAGKPSSTKTGTIRIKITVDASGKVISASYASGDGPAAGDHSVRESCRKAALQSKFTALTLGTADQNGTITWRFK